MRISGSLPFNVAQAYGIQSKSPAQATPPTPVTPAAPTSAVKADDPAAHVRPLVGATVSAAMGFDGAASTPPAAVPNGFAMYTRAADRMEVATALAIGRTIDVKG